MNQKELIGTWLSLQNCRSISQANMADCMLEFMKFLGRVDLAQRFEVEVNKMKPTLDLVLMRQFNKMKLQGVRATTWITAHKQHCTLLMDKADLECVIQAGPDLTSVAPQIARLRQSCRAGEAVFAIASAIVSAEQVSVKLKTALDDVVRVGFTDEPIKQYRVVASDYVRNCSKGQLGSGERIISVDIQGMKSTHEIQDIMSEADLRLFARIKHLSLGYAGGPPKLFHEKLVTTDQQTVRCVVPPKLLTDIFSMRTAFVELVPSDAITDFATYQKAAKQASSALLALDRTARLEFDFICSGAEACFGSKVQALCLQASPTAANFVTMQQASDDLKTLREAVLGQVARESSKLRSNVRVTSS